jgi:hypothetical protein
MVNNTSGLCGNRLAADYHFNDIQQPMSSHVVILWYEDYGPWGDGAFERQIARLESRGSFPVGSG